MMRLAYSLGCQGRCWMPASGIRHATPVCRFRSRPGHLSRNVAIRAMSPVQDTEENPSELNERTIEELMDMGMSREEAEAEAAWDPTEADPLQGQSMSFDNLYSLNDEVPDDVREELTRVGYGPPAMIAAGFRLEEYAVMRYLMDSLGANQVRLLIADEEMLHKSLDDALQTEEIDWEAPRPEEAVHGGGWGSSRACMFSGLSVAQQGALIEILESQGIDNIAVCAAVPQAAQELVGKLLSEAVLEDQRQKKEEKRETERQARAAARAKQNAAKNAAEGSGAQKIPQWADDADPEHVVSGSSGRLPDIREELKDRLKTVTDNVRKAETTDDIDLDTGLSKEEIAQRKAFLQGLLPEEKLDEYLRDLKKSDEEEAKFSKEDIETASEAKKEAEKAVLSGDPESDSFPPVYETYEEHKARKAAESAKTKESSEDEKAKDVDPSWRMAGPGELWEGMGDITEAVDEAAAEAKSQNSKDIDLVESAESKKSSESDMMAKAEKDALLIRDEESISTEDPAAGYIEQMQQLPEESIQTNDHEEDLFPDATVVSPSSAAPFFTTQEESDSKVRSMRSQTIDIVPDSLAELASDDSAVSRGALGDLSAMRSAFGMPDGMASALDDVILGDEESEASEDDEAWLQGQMGATASGRASSVRSKRAQRDSRPKPNMPDSVISETSMNTSDYSEDSPQQAGNRNSTLPWLKPDKAARTHEQHARSDADSGYKVPEKSAEDSSMDAISRALKSGVDKETLKRYIDEVADTVADNAGSWLRDQPKKKEASGNSRALADALRTVKHDDTIEYGPPIPPKNPNWSMEEEVAAENAERAKQAQRAQREGAAMLNGSGTGDPERDQGPRIQSSLAKDSHIMNDLRLNESSQRPNVKSKVHSATRGANFNVPGVNGAQPQDSPSATPAPGATPNLRWDRYNSSGTNTTSKNTVPGVHTTKNGGQGVNGTGLDVDYGAQISESERIRMMDDERLPTNMGKLRNPSDRGQGGSVETSIGQLLDDEEATVNSDLYGESAGFFEAYKPQGSALTRKDGSNKSEEGPKGSGGFGKGAQQEQMRNFASGWRRGAPGQGMNRVREMYSHGSFSEDSAAKLAAEREAQLEAEREFDQLAEEGEQEASARPATLEQLKVAAERHGLDLQKLIADAKAKGVEVEGA